LLSACDGCIAKSEESGVLCGKKDPSGIECESLSCFSQLALLSVEQIRLLADEEGSCSEVDELEK